MSEWMDEIEKAWENTRHNTVVYSPRSQREKLRALREEFGYRKPELVKDNENNSIQDSD